MPTSTHSSVHQPAGSPGPDQVERPDWLDLATYPYTLRSLDVAGGPITYVDEGEGPTLLFVHAGMWSYVFRDVIERLSGEFRCITLDLPGNGLTPEHEGVGDLGGFSRTLHRFVQVLDLTEVTLIVHDLGGLVGLGAAGIDPTRYRGLVMANAFAWTPDTRGLRTMLRVVGSRPVTALDVTTNLIARITSGKAGVGRHLDDAGRAAFRGPFRSRAPRRMFHRLMRSALRDPGFTGQVSKATRTVLNHLPVLSIYGENNDPFGFQDRVAGTWPDHEGIIVEGGNHFPMMDDPALFADSISDWHARKVA
jgi:haloalkane dehalogenase